MPLVERKSVLLLAIANPLLSSVLIIIKAREARNKISKIDSTPLLQRNQKSSFLPIQEVLLIDSATCLRQSDYEVQRH